MSYIELEGGSLDKHPLYVAKALCPLTGERKKSLFCPKRSECKLPEVGVRASSGIEAREFANYAIETGAIPRCDNNKPLANLCNSQGICKTSSKLVRLLNVPPYR